ncbi:MAG: HAD-IA family hydrolase [Caldilineaceae bacterium]|nr:HAD-IA family hydrolase [Caldilineaceae bacterium]
MSEERHVLAICFDCGDTLVDEGTEVKNGAGATLRAELIPGAASTVRELHRRGYPLALVADGPRATFENVLHQHDLWHEFTVFAISGDLGVEKPAPQIFYHALNQLQIAPERYNCVVMIGNNLARDIRGANQLGLISVWLDWAPRRSKVPADALETPDHTVRHPHEILDLIESIERQHL